MFNIFPKYGSPGDCASIDDLTGKSTTNWFYTSVPTFTVNGKTYKADELSQYIGELLTENQGLKNELEAIEEDGTLEHHEAIKLRQENAQLKVELKRLQEFENWHQPELCAETINELTKEVKGLRHLKEENVRLMERVNEIDSDQNEEYRAEILTLKNDIAVWREKYTKLLEKYNGTVTMGGLKYMEAKLQIVQNNYKKCTQERDGFKHQLNAANKEIKKLKEDIVDYVIEKDDELEKTKNWNKLNEVKTEKVYVCNHCGYKIGHNTNQWGGCACCKDGLMIEKEEVQKHPMYPIHWGGWDKVEEKVWQCPCNKCKEAREGRAEDDLATKVAKLEKQVKELKIINICQKQP
jgi:phage host-nuclease inhibitor protein Gam